MKILSILSLVFLINSAWADLPAADPALAGSWETVNPTAISNGPDSGTDYETLEFNADFTSATWTAVCTFSSGVTINASASTRVSISHDKINVLDSNAQEVDDIDGVPGHVGRRCRVWIGRVNDTYTISNGLLVLTADGGNQVTFKKQ